MGINLSLDLTGAAVVYAASTAYSWAKTLAVPGIQALANIKVLEYQNKQYREIRKEQREVLDLSLDNYAARLNNIMGDLKEAYPSVPKAARYVPVNPCQEQREVIECNIEATSRAYEWANCVNRLNDQQAIARAVMFDPKWVKNIDLHAMTIGDLLRGKFPVPVSPVLADADEQAALIARMGDIGFVSSRMTGLSVGRSRATGRREFIQEADMMETLSPQSRQVDLRDMMETPAQRIALALSQAQLIQNSLQNVLNQNAQKPPHRLARISAKLERAINLLQLEGSKASMIGTHVPNYVSILQPQISAITNSVGSMLTSTKRTNFGDEGQPSPYTNYPVVEVAK